MSDRARACESVAGISGTHVALLDEMAPPPSGILARLLRPFSRVHAGEGAMALLMMLAVFLILTSYYVMKTVREGLILTDTTFDLGGDELKTYATGAMALLLVILVPAYGALANRVRRIRLINVSYALVMACLVAFFLLGRAGVPVAIAFFVWIGLVSIFLIAQFWSYANDIYSEEQGKRLFAIIAVGGSLGAILGPRVAKLAESFTLMPIAAAILVAAVVLFNVVERLHRRAQPADRVADDPIGGQGGFTLVLNDRYLLLIAAMLVAVNVVNTTGEYILSNAAAEHAAHLVPGDAEDTAVAAERRELIKTFYSDFFFWVNLVAFLLQAFVVSRVIRWFGVRRALFALPLVALATYGGIAVIGGVALIRVLKIAENGTDYSLQNTLRQMLFLPTSRDVKYKAKAAIDTFFMRAGDLLAALVVFVGVNQLGLQGRQLAIANVALIGAWFAIAVGIARHHARLSPDRPARHEPAGVPAGAHA
jgi:AAA family ATP:ADP antiporter